MRFYMQQVNALRGVPGNHCPSHSPTHRDEKGPSARALTPVVENQGGGGRTLGESSAVSEKHCACPFI